MAITFEENKQSPFKAVLVGAVVLAMLGGAGYFGWRFFISNSQSQPQTVAQGIQLQKDILTDPRLDSLELMPQIPPLTETPGRDNPFVPYLAGQANPSSTNTNGVAAPAAAP